MFTPETYFRRRAQLSQKIGSGLILLLGNNDSPMNFADNCYHFRQDSTFLYYFGIDFPGLAAVIDVDNQTHTLFGDDYSIDDIVWMGPQPTIAERAQQAGISIVKPFSQLEKVLNAATSRKVHFLPPYRNTHSVQLFDLLGIKPAQLESMASVELIRAVVSQREIKSDDEIIEIEKAVDLSVDMHVAAMNYARPGMTEAQIAAHVYHVAMEAGCEVSFPIIATINGQTLHNHFHGNVIQNGDLFLLDAGAETQSHYAGDLSSTFPVSSGFDSRQKIIYEMSLQAHEAAIAALGLNVPYRNVHLAACRSITENMKSLGFLRGDTDDLIDAGVHALFLPCGTGHMMGLDVHDMENLGEVWVGYDGHAKSTLFGLKSLRLAKPLKSGHVFTVEPGIYFIPELMDKWKAEGLFSEFIDWNALEHFRNFGGIRNEENFMMTEKGPRRLGSKQKPVTIDQVETIRRNALGL